MMARSLMEGTAQKLTQFLLNKNVKQRFRSFTDTAKTTQQLANSNCTAESKRFICLFLSHWRYGLNSLVDNKTTKKIAAPHITFGRVMG
ncbi:hypothetical protein [Lactobacillus sp. ESL0681]|uniref:hypothetical protein n=1 Tax=Lactobacillus sp. ESL0681 TaxID=2983211 RepID=UPI0023F683FA|nr:hypothetical protein [Lactobacillus sp. ESL0681]WEV39954.1 hypothetical protein OZX59_07020 [Lactobacillus sp. ESL0681]